MAAASKTLDPITAAEAGIAGSKDLIAAVARDLGQHERWLAHYYLAEKRHARRVMLQELVARLEDARLRLMAALKRLALRTLRSARTAASFVWRTTVAVLVILGHTLAACAAWLRPKLIALALILRRWLAVSWAWAVATSGSLVLAARGWLAAFWSWADAQSRVLVRTAREWLAAFLAWTIAKSRALAAVILAWAVAASAWLSPRARIAADAAEKRLKAGCIRIERSSRALALASCETVSAATLRLAAQARALELSLKDQFSSGAATMRKQAQTLFWAFVALASAGYSRAACTLWQLARRDDRARSLEANHRALTVRRSTALICIEPSRTRLPALRPT